MRLDRSVPLTLQCAILAAFAGACQAQPSLTLDELSLDPSGNNKVVFTWVQTTPGVSIDPAHLALMGLPNPTTSDNGAYRVYVAVDKISPTKAPNDIAYYLYSQPASAVDKGLFTEHVVVGTSHGDFPDQWSSVKFHLTESGLHQGEIKLPIHCPSTVPLISVVPNPDAGTIYLSSPDHKLSFAATNLLKGFEVDIESVELTTNNNGFWRSNDPNDPFVVKFGNSKLPYSMTTAPLSGDATVVPKVWSSLVASARTLGADEPHDVLTLTVRHSAGLGGTLRVASAQINVRFRPPWWSLLAAAMIGAVLGSALTLLFPATWKGTTAVRTVGSAVLLAVVAEILGMLMFQSDKSKLVIGGLTLEPTQALPAMGLGILVGLLGLKVFDAFKIPLPTR